MDFELLVASSMGANEDIFYNIGNISCPHLHATCCQTVCEAIENQYREENKNV